MGSGGILIEIILLGLSLIGNVFAAVYTYRAKKSMTRIIQMAPNIAEITAVIRDINRAGGGMMEIKRVDPRSIFTRGV